MLFFMVAIPCIGLGQPPTHTAKFSPALHSNINGFWEYLPRDYDADISTSYPLLIYLHGAGDQGQKSILVQVYLLHRRHPRIPYNTRKPL